MSRYMIFNGLAVIKVEDFKYSKYLRNNGQRVISQCYQNVITMWKMSQHYIFLSHSYFHI